MTYAGDPWLEAKLLEKFGPAGLAELELEARMIYYAQVSGSGSFGYRLYRMRKARARRNGESRD